MSTFVNKVNGMNVYARRAKATTTGRDIDEALDSKQDQMTEMTDTEVSDLLAELA